MGEPPVPAFHVAYILAAAPRTPLRLHSHPARLGLGMDQINWIWALSVFDPWPSTPTDQIRGSNTDQIMPKSVLVRMYPRILHIRLRDLR